MPMDDLLLFCRLVLTGTFALAGVAKIRGPQAFAEGMQGLGVPSGLERVLATTLPWAELGIAALLLTGSMAWAAAVAALVLLALFTGLIALRLTQGLRPACNCFGQVSAAPIGPWTLVRNLALSGCALLIVLAGRSAAQPDAITALADWNFSGDMMTLILLLLCLLTGVATWLVFQLMAQHGRLMLRLDNLELRLAQRGEPGPAPVANDMVAGLDVGTLAPDFSLRTLGGGTSSLRTLLQQGLPLVLVFSDPECGPCNLLAPRLLQWQRELQGRVVLALISRGEVAQNARKLGAERLDTVLLQADREVAQAYQVFATPSAVRISAAGLIDSSIAMADLAIDALVHDESGLAPISATPPSAAVPMGNLPALA